MSFPHVIGFLIGVADLALGGFISNGFMVTMMVMEWTKYKKLGPNGQLLLSVGLCNICGSLSVVINLIIRLYILHPLKNAWFQIIFPFSVSVLYFRFWLAAWLCVFYCIKIANTTCSSILWCKRRIAWLIPQLILGALLVSFLLYFAVFSSLKYATESSRRDIANNGTQGMFRSYRLFVITTGIACPFLVVLLCSALSIASLGRHLRHITGGESSSQSFQTKAHMKAIGTMVSLLFLYISWFLAQIFPNPEIVKEEIIHLFFMPMYILYSPVQAAILVLANPKLKHAAMQILHRTQI